MRSVNGQYEEIGIKWPFPWPEMSIPWPQISLWPSYLLNSISEKNIYQSSFTFSEFCEQYTVIYSIHVLLSIEILIKNSIDSHPGKITWATNSGLLFIQFQWHFRLWSFLSAFRCMEKNISFFLTGDLQITFLRNKSNWPKMTGNYWAIKLCARPLMHRGGVWFIKKKKEVV